MTTEQQDDPRSRFVPATLPWLVAAGALALYLATLNHWLSFGSLFQFAKLAGWTWQPNLHGPLYWLVTYPLRWLPVNAIPLALNLFSAVCAALTLALLARSVALLPHDRTQEQRDREKSPFALLTIRRSWLPPVLAVLICGLQLTFWEQATAGSSAPPLGASGEMFDLLLFAYIIRCLLEFRIDQEESWLTRAAFIYALGITNNWAFVGFFPLFLLALLRTKGLTFFSTRFLTRMSLWGLAGLLLYLLLPLVQSLAEIGPVPFWLGLKSNLSTQKYLLTLLYQNARHTVWLLGLTSLLPILIVSIRWSSYFGDDSPMGAGFATFVFHIIHCLFLLACVWVAFDPPISPRSQGLGIPFLTFYYLGALSVGYFCGYFLLLTGRRGEGSRRTPSFLRLVNKFVVAGIWILLFAAPALLIARNLPQIRTTNGPMMKNYLALITSAMPKGSIMFSDDPRRLLLAKAAATRDGTSEDHLFLESGSLKWADYHRFLKKKYGQRWPVNVPKTAETVTDDRVLLGLMYQLARSNTVYYLHPSFGFYFEYFYAEPHGMLYKLKPYPTNSILAPLASPNLIAENETFWAKAKETLLDSLAKAVAPSAQRPNPGFLESVLEHAHLQPEPNREAMVLASFCSRALDSWGVDLQKSGHLKEAAQRFEEARELNPENLVARVNLECNKNLQAGGKGAVQLSESLTDTLGKYRRLDPVLNEYGPFDEPTYCYQQGLVFAEGHIYTQAAQQFNRAKELAPQNLAARIWLAQLYVIRQMPDDALREVQDIYAQARQFGLAQTNQSDVLFVELSAHAAKMDLAGAETAAQAALAKFPDDTNLLAVPTQVYMKYGQYSNALPSIDRQLKATPQNAALLVNKGFCFLQLGEFEQAIPPLSRALDIETNSTSDLHMYAQLNLAIAYLRSHKLDDAKRNYDQLEKIHPNSYPVEYGLQEITYQRKDTNAALHYAELYLGHAPSDQPEAETIRNRVKELRPSKP